MVATFYKVLCNFSNFMSAVRKSQENLKQSGHNMAVKYIYCKGNGLTGVCYYTLDSRYRGKPDKCFFYCFRLKGKMYWEKVGRLSDGITAQYAAQLRREHMQKLKGVPVSHIEEVQKQIEKNNVPFGEIADAYFNSKSSELKGYVTDKNRYEKHLKPLFEQKPIKGISIFDIDYIKNTMTKTHKQGTISNVLELLRRIVNYGYKYNLSPKLSFVIEMPKSDNEVIEYLKQEEVERFFAVLNDWPARDVVHMLQLAFFTAMRRGEIFKLITSDLDFDMKLIRLRDPKGKKSVSIPMNTTSEEILRKQLEWRLERYPESDYVFPGKTGGQRVECTAASRIKEAAQLPKNFRPFHGLRHHFAVMMANSGNYTLDMIGTLLTHKSKEMTARYGQFLPETTYLASEKAAEILKQSISCKKQ